MVGAVGAVGAIVTGAGQPTSDRLAAHASANPRNGFTGGQLRRPFDDGLFGANNASLGLVKQLKADHRGVAQSDILRIHQH